MRYLLVFGFVVLAGCEKPVEEMGYAEISALRDEIAQRCTDLGLDANSAQHQQCRQIEAQKEITTRRANAARRQQGFQNAAASLQATSQGYSQAAMQPQYQPRSPVNCQSVRYGNTVRTNCY